MRRADRLFQIVQMLRMRRVTTAALLAERLEVSRRTIYRDIRDLIAGGVPVEGEAGVGYVLARTFDLPPLMFTEDELEAIVLGARVVMSWADPELARSADQALGKIELVIPERLKRKLQHLALFSPNLQRSAPVQGRGAELTLMRKAVRDRRKLRFSYQRADGCESLRTVRPVSLSFFPPVWLLSAWCELRGDFRSFRTDRITSIELGSETFRDEPGKTLQDFLKQVTGDEA